MLLQKPSTPIPNDLKSIRLMVKKGEGHHLEFKLKTNHPEKIVKEIVAFANTDGGKLLIGVSDDREVKGLRFADEDSFILEKAIEKYIYPMIDYQLEKVRVEGEYEILVFDILPSPMKPHFVDLDNDATTRKAYVRVDDKSIQASKEVKEILKGQRKAKGLRFVFGDKEKLLMTHIAKEGFATISDFCRIAAIPRKQASRTLVLLTLTNVLKIAPQEGSEDRFMEK